MSIIYDLPATTGISFEHYHQHQHQHQHSFSEFLTAVPPLHLPVAGESTTRTTATTAAYLLQQQRHPFLSASCISRTRPIPSSARRNRPTWLDSPLSLRYKLLFVDTITMAQSTPSSTTKDKNENSNNNSNNNDGKALLCMALLALQCGIQPILTKRYTPDGITRSTVIMVQEFLKFCMAGVMLHLSTTTTTTGKAKTTSKGGIFGRIRQVLQKEEWTVLSWLQVAGVPASLYAFQNIAALQAYQNLDPLTFNVLNQTKTLWAAFCCYFIMGRGQSTIQMLSLILLLVSALVVEKIVNLQQVWDFFMGTAFVATEASSSSAATMLMDAQRFTKGVVPVLLASFSSGLAGTLSQKNLQNSRKKATAGGSSSGRNPYLFSMELCVGSFLILAASLLVSSDGQKILQHGFFQGWTIQTLIPITTNAAGGIIVGLVTKYAGSVRKGFALIFGIFLSGLLQAQLGLASTGGAGGVSIEQVLGGLLVAASMYMHITNPPAPPQPTAKKQVKQD